MPQLTIDLTAQQATRLLDAFKGETNNPDATVDDVKARLVHVLRDIVIHWERQAYQPSPFDPT